ncbi:hypothetical protein [Methylobacterium hispanicum]|uniref:hypothetical protein n=1 Tax=Methylobacterium hispanicum TaxID=270350 RepID=UPI002F2B9ACB
MHITHLYKATGAATGNVAVQLADNFSDQLQIDLEPQAAGSVGRVNVLFRTPGMSRLKALHGADGNPVSIELANPYPVALEGLAIEQLVFQPVAVTGSYSVAITRSFTDAAIGPQIDALEDLADIHGASPQQLAWLTELRAYRLACSRLVRGGIVDPKAYPPRPVLGTA